MKIRISDIPPQGLKVNDTMQLDSLNSRMSEGRDQDIHFLSSPCVEITVFKTPGGATARGTVKARYTQSCSRCLDPIERQLDVDVDLVLQHTGQRDARRADLGEEPEIEDIGVVYFDGENVELEEVLQENLILALDLFWHPPVKDDGSCSLCGLKFTGKLGEEAPTTTLGALIQGAVEKKS